MNIKHFELKYPGQCHIKFIAIFTSKKEIILGDMEMMYLKNLGFSIPRVVNLVHRKMVFKFMDHKVLLHPKYFENPLIRIKELKIHKK